MAKLSVSLKSYLSRRILQAIPVVFSVIVLTFFLVHLSPGDPVDIFLGEFRQNINPEYVEMVREQLGLDRPLNEQFLIYLRKVMVGDLGYSFTYRQPVAQLILERIPATLLLTGIALVFSSIIGVILGVISSKRPYSVTDSACTLVSIIGYGVPAFWLGQMLVLIFAVYLRWFPVAGMRSIRVDLTGIPGAVDILRHLLLPVIALAFHHLALNTRLTRANMFEVLRQDFILTARSKGLDENTVFYRHALRNALLPVITVIGMDFGFMFMGSVTIETVFAWPGMGRLMYDSIYSRDYPVILGLFIVISIIVVTANVITDAICAFLDPRIRLK